MPMPEVTPFILVFVFSCSSRVDHLENTEDPNSAYAQQILGSKPNTWQEKLYKFYFRANRLYKRVSYYAWRFADLHSYKLVLLIMVLVAVLKVNPAMLLMCRQASSSLSSDLCVQHWSDHLCHDRFNLISSSIDD